MSSLSQMFVNGKQSVLKIGAVATASLLLGMASASASVPVPVLEFKFNGNGTSETSTGSNTTTGSFVNFGDQATDLHSAAGGGVSGLPGDRAFNNNASTQMGGTAATPGEGGAFRAGNSALSLSAFTISGWYNAASTPGNFARLAVSSDLSILFNANADGHGLQLSFGGGSHVIAPRTGAGSVYYNVDTWTFFAISFETGNTDNVKFYAGTSDIDLYLVGTYSLNRTSALAASNLMLGNTTDRARPFDGTMDNFRLWDSVLDTDALRAVYAADLNNSPIPESSTYALLAAAAMFGVALLLRRRKYQAVA